MSWQGAPPLLERRLTPIGGPAFGIAIALAAMATGIVYFLLVGRRLLPDRPARGEIARVEQGRDFMFELQITGEFNDPGATLMELGWRGRYNVSVLEIRRRKQRMRTVSAREQVFIGDRLIISGEYDDVMRLARTEGIEHARPAEDSLGSGENTIVTEMVATPWFESNPNSLTDYGSQSDRIGPTILKAGKRADLEADPHGDGLDPIHLRSNVSIQLR